ncbi:hypothetical protein DFQ27_009279 [Actinomortierella ambigua]|uniref:Uncharacterized protein n=1 Tax=Actinomortierella ambigua TaxID=1343610 RepID=A0A9P6PRL6_9FUNG|nr:hypothetical protein DFQ27_009279 [Actinomortierella ambigua]
MHRQRIRDIQRLHEQQQLFASPHHRLTRRHKPAASVSRPYHDVGFPSHNLSHSQLHQQQFQQQQQQQQAHGPPSLSSSHNIQALEGNKAQGLVAQPATPQPNVARAGVAAAAWSDEQHPPRQDHYVRRFQLAQRMLQIQQMLHTQRIQQLHFMHKLSKVQQPQQQLQQQHQQNPVPELMISTPTIPSSPSSPTATNASTVVVLPQDKPKVSLSQEPCSSPNIPVGTKKASSMAEIARISLPHVDTIRKQRRQRLKAQARLRQAAAERSLKTTTTTAVDVKNDGSDAHSTVKEDATSAGNTLVGSVTSGALSDRGDEAACTTKLTLPLSSAQHVRQINKSSDAALRLSDCSISHARLKTKAELAYKKQLVRQQSLQHHMIQDHTNRYRIYQAYCLMQRAREAQAMDELKVIELKQVQTRAWVESLRCQVELEVPK